MTTLRTCAKSAGQSGLEMAFTSALKGEALAKPKGRA